jgi:hypothetical protein
MANAGQEDYEDDGVGDACDAVIPPPALSVGSAASVLDPPDHRYVAFDLDDLQLAVSVGGRTDLLTGADVRVARVSADEAENAPGSGDTANDILISPDCRSLEVRSERAGRGNGRVYTVHLFVADPFGQVATAEYRIGVPHSASRPAVRDGVVNLVLSSCQPPAPIAGGGSSAMVAGGTVRTGSAQAAVRAATPSNPPPEAGATPAIPTSVVLERALPNPVTTTGTVRFGLPAGGRALVRLFDVTGRLVATLSDSELDAGYHEVALDATALAAGPYLVRLEAAGRTLTGRVTVTR